MADFDLIQTDAQVQSILNDGQNMQGAGAQTTLTTESVLLKDVNGNYHKILKSSFTEAIRDTLAGLLVNNDKGTTINQIAAIASGDFGSITPANLASVLGVNMVGAKIYAIHNVGGIALEGPVGWSTNGLIIEVFTKVNKPTYQKFLIGFNATVLGNSISRIQYNQIRDTNPLHFYYSGTPQNARIVINAGEPAIFKITCGSGINLVENTDITGMTEKTFE